MSDLTPTPQSRNLTPPSFSSVPLPNGREEMSEVAKFLNGRIGKLALRIIAGTAAEEFLDGIKEPHTAIDNCPLVLDLKSKAPDLRSVRSFQLANLALYLAFADVLSESLGEFSAASNLLATVEQSTTKLERDLHYIHKRKDGTEALPRLSQEEIGKIQPLQGLPPIHSIADFRAYNFIIAGSGLGARVQGSRQKKNLGVGYGIGQGAEFLNAYGSGMGAGIATVAAMRELNKLNREERKAAIATGILVMRKIEEAFRKASFDAHWVAKSAAS